MSKIELGICYSMILLENVIYRLLISLIINKKNDFSCSDPVCASNMKKIHQKLMIFDELPCVESIYEMSGANDMILRENQSKSVHIESEYFLGPHPYACSESFGFDPFRFVPFWMRSHQGVRLYLTGPPP